MWNVNIPWEGAASTPGLPSLSGEGVDPAHASGGFHGFLQPGRSVSIPPPQVLVLRLRDSVVRLGEELEQAALAEARERNSAHYCQQRLADMRLEMEELGLREQESSRRCMELVRADTRGRQSATPLRGWG